MDHRQRHEFHEALLDADSFEDLNSSLKNRAEALAAQAAANPN
jgi:hypothetical protein